MPIIKQDTITQACSIGPLRGGTNIFSLQLQALVKIMFLYIGISRQDQHVRLNGYQNDIRIATIQAVRHCYNIVEKSNLQLFNQYDDMVVIWSKSYSLYLLKLYDMVRDG